MRTHSCHAFAKEIPTQQQGVQAALAGLQAASPHHRKAHVIRAGCLRGGRLAQITLLGSDRREYTFPAKPMSSGLAV